MFRSRPCLFISFIEKVRFLADLVFLAEFDKTKSRDSSLVTLVFVSRRAHGEREAVDGEGEDDGRALLRRDGVQRLQVSQLEAELKIHLL